MMNTKGQARREKKAVGRRTTTKRFQRTQDEITRDAMIGALDGDSMTDAQYDAAKAAINAQMDGRHFKREGK